MKKAFFTAVIALFIALSIIFIWLKSAMPEFDFSALMGGNIIMFSLSCLSFIMVDKKLESKAGAFVRSVYSATFLKLSVCVISVVTYALINRPDIHKPSLFILFGIYILYTIIETILLSKLARVSK